jgi:hypothetical protein
MIGRQPAAGAFEEVADRSAQAAPRGEVTLHERLGFRQFRLHRGRSLTGVNEFADLLLTPSGESRPAFEQVARHPGLLLPALRSRGQRLTVFVDAGLDDILLFAGAQLRELLDGLGGCGAAALELLLLQREYR